MKKKSTLLILLFLGLLFFNCVSKEKTEYKIAKTYNLEGNGFWDYLAIDEKTDRLFVSHAMVTQVLDTKNGKLIGTIPNTNGVHGIALNYKNNKAFISCGKDSLVKVIDLTTLKFIKNIKTLGVNPDAILNDTFSDQIFVFNGGSKNATIINAKTDSILGYIALSGKPEFAVSDGKGKVFVNIEDKSLVSLINAKTLKVENSWSLSPGEEPSGLAIDLEKQQLFSVCSNKKMIVMNALNGKLVQTIAIGDGSDGCAFDSKLKRVYSSNGEGTLTIVQQEASGSYSVLQTLTTKKGGRTLGLNKTTHHIYIPTAAFGPAPKPTKENPNPWPTILPNTFKLLEITPN